VLSKGISATAGDVSRGALRNSSFVFRPSGLLCIRNLRPKGAVLVPNPELRVRAGGLPRDPASGSPTWALLLPALPRLSRNQSPDLYTSWIRASASLKRGQSATYNPRLP